MIQIKDVTKLYPAKGIGPTAGSGKEMARALFTLSTTSLCMSRRGSGCRSWGPRGRGNRRW